MPILENLSQLGLSYSDLYKFVRDGETIAIGDAFRSSHNTLASKHRLGKPIPPTEISDLADTRVDDAGFMRRDANLVRIYKRSVTCEINGDPEKQRNITILLVARLLSIEVSNNEF